MIAVILLAAGVGKRLGAAGPKVLLEFGGRSLLERHVSALLAHGLTDISLTVGYESGAIRAAAARLGLPVRFVENPDFRAGSMVSLAVQDALLRRGTPVVLMDGDVLYDPEMIGRLLGGAGENVLLMDREVEPGDEPVKICLRGDTIVDFRKKPEIAHDFHGESVGFFRFSADTARQLADRCGWYAAQGQTGLEYEEAIRDLILAAPGRFAATDISDLAWTEIDFNEDLVRAREMILPRLEKDL